MSNAAPRARRSSLGAPLPPDFYNRATEVVARELLGAVLEHRSPDGVARGRIVEVEAYLGVHDPASHAATGLSERNRHLHGPPGTAYVYFIYGMHYCVNTVTREEGLGSGVLIRAVEPLSGVPLMRQRRRGAPDRELTNGPGKVCQALGIDAALGGTRLDRGALRVLCGTPIADEDVVVAPRVGISKAADWPLRFMIRGNRWVSRPNPASRG
jgi:DNA-3-methyladenine glycosylase